MFGVSGCFIRIVIYLEKAFSYFKDNLIFFISLICCCHNFNTKCRQEEKIRIWIGRDCSRYYRPIQNHSTLTLATCKHGLTGARYATVYDIWVPWVITPYDCRVFSLHGIPPVDVFFYLWTKTLGFSFLVEATVKWE